MTKGNKNNCRFLTGKKRKNNASMHTRYNINKHPFSPSLPVVSSLDVEGLEHTTFRVSSHFLPSRNSITYLIPPPPVATSTPGACLCQCNSLGSSRPLWSNINCGGTWIPPVSLLSSSSTSTDKSHNVMAPSADETATTESSVGWNSTLVIASW